jgi:hypothetical protein
MGQHTEMTRHAFISHMEDYMKKLLKDPIHADTDDFLKYHGYTGPKALSVLLKRQDLEDENSSILIKNISIKDNGVDENGKRLKDTFTVKYRIPRKDYTKKMRNLYISLFENNIIENSPINEGAWGYGILDNDKAVDKQTSFGVYALNLLTHNIEYSTDSEERWANLGVLVDFLKKYDHEELRFRDEFNYAIELCKTTVNNFNQDETFISTWDNPNRFQSELKRIYRDVINITYDKDRLNEEGEGGGATTADASGPYTAPAFVGPIKRKTMYITQEQENYLKKVISEEAVMNTQAGDFGYDAPIGNKNDDFYKEANNHKNIMKKSWPNE